MKPSVAFESQKKARINLQKKVARMRALVEKGECLTDLPVSLRQFNAWANASGVQEDRFDTNANETLARNQDIRSAAIELMALVKTLLQRQPHGREESVARAKEQARLHKTIRQIAEAEMSRAHNDVRSLREENEALRAQSRSIAEEAIRIKEQLERELASERKKVAELLTARGRDIKVIK